jgi:cytochrome c
VRDLRCSAGAVLLGWLIAGCEPSIGPPPESEAEQHGTELVVPGFETADLERGELLSYACQACHTLRVGEPHQIGPNLHGVFGRRAGVAADFEYSDALRGSQIIWTPETLDAWLANPQEFLRGTKMVFAGYSDANDRRDLIAYLILATD